MPSMAPDGAAAAASAGPTASSASQAHQIRYSSASQITASFLLLILTPVNSSGKLKEQS